MKSFEFKKKLREIADECDGNLKIAATLASKRLGERISVARMRSELKNLPPQSMNQSRKGRRAVGYEMWEEAVKAGMFGKKCDQCGRTMKTKGEMIVRHKIRRTDAPDFLMNREWVWVTHKSHGQPEDQGENKRVDNIERLRVISELFGDQEAYVVQQEMRARGILKMLEENTQ